MNQPKRWTIDQLRADAATARAKFRDERLAEVAAYKAYFTSYATAFRTLIPRVADLQAGSVDTAALTAIIRVPEMFTALRYLTAPPISDDDLMSIADVDSLAPGTITRNPAHLTAVPQFEFIASLARHNQRGARRYPNFQQLHDTMTRHSLATCRSPSGSSSDS